MLYLSTARLTTFQQTKTKDQTDLMSAQLPGMQWKRSLALDMTFLMPATQPLSLDSLSAVSSSLRQLWSLDASRFVYAPTLTMVLVNVGQAIFETRAQYIVLQVLAGLEGSTNDTIIQISVGSPMPNKFQLFTWYRYRISSSFVNVRR